MKFDRTIFIGKFTQEAKELIQQLNEGLIQLEHTPQNHESIKRILRASHTLKGSSKILRFHHLNQLSHKMEDLLIGVQDGQIPLHEDILELLFKSTDLLSQCVEAILRGTEERIDITEICHLLEYAAHGENISPMLSQSSPEVLSAAPGSHQKDQKGLAIEETIRVGVDKLDNAIRLIGEIAVSHRKSEHSLLILKEIQRVVRTHVKQLQEVFQGAHEVKIRNETKTILLTSSLQLLQGIEKAFKENQDEFAFMDLVTSELYDDVLKMRMLPLSVVFDTFPRAVRDLAKYFQKDIELHIMGEDTILDKKIIEKLDGPLIHILRNCIDHGIEHPKERIAQGKPATGRIGIRAFHKSGHIKIEVTDDGRGLQLEQLKQKAIQRGILSEEHARTLSETELINLVFLPRLSTSEIITDISGRGVGMDIVKVNIDMLKGSVTLKSSPGQGTSCILTLPMTLTTLRSLIISTHNTLFAVPINAIEETIQISAHEYIRIIGRNAIRLRNQIIYVVELADVLGLKKGHSRTQERNFILIARTNGKRIGFLVDEILDEQNIVVKQLPVHMQHAKAITGATISSHNRIILILHIPEILELVKQITVELQEPEYQNAEGGSPRILVVDDSVNTGEIEKRILEAYGYQVDLALDGVEALERLENIVYDLIVTDIEMPRMDGFTLTGYLRNMPKYANIPIVIVTSLEREADKRRGLEVGANAYITKGNFEQRNLIETVKSLI